MRRLLIAVRAGAWGARHFRGIVLAFALSALAAFAGAALLGLTLRPGAGGDVLLGIGLVGGLAVLLRLPRLFRRRAFVTRPQRKTPRQLPYR